MRKVTCRQCQQVFTDPLNVVSIEQTGYCVSCEHLLSDNRFSDEYLENADEALKDEGEKGGM